MSQRKDVVPKDGAAKKIRMIQMGTMDFIEMQKASELQVPSRCRARFACAGNQALILESRCCLARCRLLPAACVVARIAGV